MRYSFEAAVVSVVPETKRVHVGGVGDTAVFEERPCGYKTTFKMNATLMSVVTEHPLDFAVNDIVKFTMEIASD